MWQHYPTHMVQKLLDIIGRKVVYKSKVFYKISLSTRLRRDSLEDKIILISIQGQLSWHQQTKSETNIRFMVLVSGLKLEEVSKLLVYTTPMVVNCKKKKSTWQMVY